MLALLRLSLAPGSGSPMVAAFREAYPGSRCTDRVAQVKATELKARPKVAAALEAAYAARMDRAEITADRVIEETARLAFSDIRKLYDSNGNLRPIDQLDEEVARALAGFEASVERSGLETVDVRKLKLWDKVAALKLLSQQLGMLTKKVEVDLSKGGVLHVSLDD